MSVKVFVDSNLMANFSCLECGESRQKDVSKFIGHETKVRLQYKCKCQNRFSVLLERRRFIRRAVSLEGYLIKKSEKFPLIIENISKHGVKIKILEKLPLKVGDTLKIEFTLDDPNESLVSKEVRIQKLIPPSSMGCEFLSCDHYGNLGKYFLFYFFQ